MTELPLGRTSAYPERYAPDQLVGIPRRAARDAAGIGEPLPFSGYDLWRAWELGWLNLAGMPQAATAEFRFDAACPNIVESKSMKLYLHGFSFSAALVPRPRAHLTRYHGVFAPASPDRSRIVPGIRTAASEARGEGSVSDRQRATSWAQRLKRVFAIDIETCRQCGGHLRVITGIEKAPVIERILDHLRHTADLVDRAHPSRAPPQGDRLV